MVSLKLIEPSAVIKNWHFFIDGFRKVLEYVDGDQTEDSIFNDLMSNRLSMQVIFNNDKYAGFVTGRFDFQPNGDKNMFINHMFIKDGSLPEIFKEVQMEMEKKAREVQCKRIVFLTNRDKGFDKKLREFGFKTRYVELVKEIGGQNG